LNSAVATVAVEMVFSLLRVVSLSLVIGRSHILVIPGHASWRGPGIQTPGNGSGFRVRAKMRAPE
jgi:hypothetical protein